jgi:hypothetical protein
MEGCQNIYSHITRARDTPNSSAVTSTSASLSLSTPRTPARVTHRRSPLRDLITRAALRALPLERARRLRVRGASDERGRGDAERGGAEDSHRVHVTSRKETTTYDTW